MRMRTRGHLEQRLNDCASLTINPKEGLPPSPLYMEIGCGKGGFICKTATLNPEINFIAVEKVSNVIVLAMEKARDSQLGNLKFIRGDFSRIAEDFLDNSVDRIYLNFSDPWPKSGYAKRRLTHGAFLGLYKRILKNGGEIHFKTDNRALFDFSLETFPENGFTLRNVTFNLHSSDFQGNIMTEYEKKFSEMGTPICRLEAIVEK